MMRIGQSTAVVVVDMQNGFCDPAGSMSKSGLDHTACADAIDGIARLLSAARRAGLPIFWTRYSLKPDYSDAGLLFELFPKMKDSDAIVRDTWDAEIVPELRPLPGEHVIDKTRYSAFHGTDLEAILREHAVDQLIVCGVTTNICVESTVRDAFARDIRVIVPSDGTGAVTPELHEAALRNVEYGFGQVATVAEIDNALAQLPRAPSPQASPAVPARQP